MDETVTFEVSGTIGQADLFQRDLPAHLEGPPAAWNLALEVIDHGCFILRSVNEVREGRAVRDSVTAALLRRVLVTAEGIRVLLTQGLEESAIGLFRTLLDLEVNLRLVTGDEADKMARRLAAFHFLTGRRHFSRVFSHPDTRGQLEEKPKEFEWTRQASRRMKKFFESPAFDDVRDEVRANQHWHGMDNVQTAYEAAGCSSDYIQLYDVYSPFTHGSNPDFDFADIVDGRPVLKALPQRDPTRTLNLLQGMVLKLVQIFELFLQDKGAPQYQPEVEVKSLEDGERFSISPVTALQTTIAQVFGDKMPSDHPSQ